MGRRARKRQGGRPQPTAGQATHERALVGRKLIGLVAATVLALAATAVLALALGRGDDDGEGGVSGGGGPDLSHVHGLGVNPQDSSLYIATHTGLFRAAQGEDEATRVGESDQDVMGFSVVSADRFLGSGHPGALQGGPSNLGLIRSDDGGRSWDSVSLFGESDFHVLRSQDNMVYGFDASNARFMASADGGEGWEERDTPGAMIDLAIHPDDASTVVASTDQGLLTSADQGRTWRTLQDGPLALLTWPEPEALYRVEGSGRVSLSRDHGRSWKAAGSIEAQPAAFASAAADELYVALPDGTVKRSTDGGVTWNVRATP
jgi:photosystem II stability/assembly factor-like uncharacterized protein